MEQWVVINKKADFNAVAQQYHIDPVTARILRNRNLIEEEEIRLYLQGDLDDLCDPHLLQDADLLVSILGQKIREGKSIRIIGDYDIDGVMSTYILRTALERTQAKVSIQIPDRILDGYGLNLGLINRAREEGVDTILTCDNGISAIAEIAHAKELGMTVLVTDHHEIPFDETDGVRTYKRSAADAIVNPHRPECAYPYKYLCGAAVAWKVVCLLYESFGIDQEEAYALLENVAFATVGDIMPLTGENRILVKEGIKRIHRTENIGMRALIAQCGLEREQIDAFHFGFVLGPCINASGRLDTAQRAMELFFAKDMAEATEIANQLVVLNEERKELTKEGVEEAIRYYEEQDCSKDQVLVIYLPDVHESIAGIIAGRIREKYYRPVFILTKGQEGAKGSGRSIEGYSMYEEMCKCSELFTKFGGHPMAAGLSLPEENIPIFRQRINELAQMTEAELRPKVWIDVPMPLDYVTMDLIREFGILAPFGKDNTKPVFADRGIKIRRLALIGKNQNIVKLSLITAMGRPASGIYFGDAKRFLDYLEEKFGTEEVSAAMSGRDNSIQLSLVYFPKINSFRGVDEVQFEIQYYK